MNPGQVDTISVSVQIPRNLESSTNLHLTLIARPDEPGADIAAQTMTSIRVFPSRPPRESLYPSLHGNVRLMVDLINGEEVAFSTEVGPLRGDLGEDQRLVIGPINLLLGGNSPGTFVDDQRISASYEDADRGYIRTGDFALNLDSPLLEHYLWGRGGDLLYETGSTGYRAFYINTKGSRPETDAGFQLIFDFGETGTARLTALRNSQVQGFGEHESSDCTSTNLGFIASFEPITGATITGEIAGTGPGFSDFDFGWRLNGRYRSPGLSLNYELLGTDPGFRGGYDDAELNRIDMSWRPIDNLNLWANYNMSRDNRDMPDEEAFHTRNFNAGGVFMIEDFGRFGITYRSKRNLDFAQFLLDERSNSTEYSFSRNFDSIFTSVLYRIQTENNLLTGDTERTRSIQARCLARFNGFSLRFDFASGRSSVNNGTLSRHLTSAGLGCDFYLDRNLFISLNAQRNVGNLSGQRTIIFGSLSWIMPEDRRLNFQLRSLSDSGGRDTEIALEYIYPIDVPIRIIPIKGRVEGMLSLSDEPDQGIPGVRILAGGFEAFTDYEGKFLFPAMAPGDYELDIDYSTLSASLIPGIDLPLRFTVDAGSTVMIEIPMIQPASMEGHLLLVNSYVSDEDIPSLPLAGILIELHNESRVDSRYTDDFGRFSFTGLVPGKYSLLIRQDTLPEYHKVVEPTEYVIDIGPGDSIKEIEFLIDPVEREIVIVPLADSN